GGRFPTEPGELPLIPAAARLLPGSKEWQLVPFPGPWDKGNFPLKYPETAIFHSDDGWHAVVRCDGGAAYTYRGDENGADWVFTGETDLPAISAKWYAGDLPDGRNYLLFNERVSGDERLRLVLLIRELGAERFSKRYVLADGWNELIHCGPYWHYPSACVFEDALYVSCTSNKEESVRNAVCIRIPLKSL
ncbi:MAG: exo-alpha-sialidase, partial [Oscillospiraceae bacterium]|nr:exo-alpha-sialidase [Oscillospiraceae bacterium]